MILLLLALQASQASQPVPAEPRGNYYRPQAATVVAEPVAVLFAGLDRDGDARTTLAEVRAGIAASTSAPEWQNGVGYIAFADWAERWLGDRNGVPSPFEIDRDGDNRITRAELEGRIEAIFNRLDTNRDGALSRAELLTVRNLPGGDRRGRGGRTDDAPNGRPPR